MTDLAGKIAVVSGASRGIGRTYALALAEAGARVIALARSVEGDPAIQGSLAELVATAKGRGLEIAPLGCDLGEEASIVDVVGKAAGLHGRIDILVNNAIWPIRRFDSLAIPLDEWDETYRINIRGTYAMTREVVLRMLQTGGGSVINMTTASAQASQLGAPTHGSPAYSITKAALERMSTYFATDLAGRNIAVNAISPGNVFRYMSGGRDPDLRFWGEPIIHLALQRPGSGMTGELLHTFHFGRTWGPKLPGQGRWDPEIGELLDEMGIAD
jgi:NAD(P)-dependent dehydrogenase (short-subunit alcohol dehydrogenase family)